MKGIIVDCKTGKVKEIYDSLPLPEMPPYIEPKGIDLAEVAQKMGEIDELKVKVSDLEKAIKTTK